MKKIFWILILLFSLNPLAKLAALEACPGKVDSINSLDSKTEKDLEELKDSIGKKACQKEMLFKDIKDPKFVVEHNADRCAQVELCVGENSDPELVKDAEELMKENLPKAVLLGVLAKEIGNNRDYNIALNYFEKDKNVTLCPSEQVDAQCEKDIRNALTSVAGNFISFNELEKAPLPGEKLEPFFNETFFKIVLEKSYFKDKKELAPDCGRKLSFNKICKARDMRMEVIKKCEARPNGVNCLYDEQKALASLLNSQKSSEELFLESEKLLCKKSRIVVKNESASLTENSPVMPAILGSQAFFINFNQKKAPFGAEDQPTTHDRPGPYREEYRQQPAQKPSASADVSSKPDSSAVIPSRSEKIEIAAPAPHKPPPPVSNFESDENIVKPNDESFGKSLSDSISVASKSFFGNENSSNTPSSNQNMNNDYTSRYIEPVDSDKLNADAIESDEKKPSEDKTKDEKKALMAQIDGLKEKIEAMSKTMDELKAKKEKASEEEEKEKLDKAASEREKTILDLKNKLAELQAEKTKRELLAKIKTEEENQAKAQSRAQKSLTSSEAVSVRYNNDQAMAAIREKEKPIASQFAGESSAASKTGGTRGGASQASTSSIVLHSVPTKTSSDSAVVYMTAGEVQKYPFHLKDKASASEIEAMLLNNNGAAIIIGESEQIVPEVVKGAIQYENGHVKYKRVKIAIVKNEKDKKESITRGISSVADLKREEQKRRDLIRYQEMKNAFKDVAK